LRSFVSNLLRQSTFSLAGQPISALEKFLSSHANPKLVTRRDPGVKPSSSGSHFWWIAIPSFIAIALAVLTVVLLFRTEDLKDALENTERQSARQVTDLANAQKTVETLGATDALHATLSIPASRQSTAQAVYQAGSGRLALVASNLPPLKFGQVYQCWLVTTGSTPMPAGTFAPDERGQASLFMAMPPNIHARGFEVTIEPAGGTMTPSGKPMLAGGIRE
jgi:Anti-sigma-K factor rskA